MQASRGGPFVSHVFFADDLLLFGEASERQAIVMENVLRTFCQLSGQRISLNKSVVFVSKNTPMVVTENICSSLQIKHTADLGKYLGVPILHGRATTKNYSFLLDNIRFRLNGWKARILSQASRCVLIQSVPFLYHANCRGTYFYFD